MKTSAITATTLVAGSILAIGAVIARADGALLSDQFPASSAAWKQVGTGGSVSASMPAAGQPGELDFHYSVDQEMPPAGQLPFAVLLRPTPVSSLAGMHGLSFEAKSDTNATYVIALTEQAGGRYVALFYLPAGQWQNVTLDYSDFSLSQNKNDPPDPDGKLDADQINSVGILAMSEMLAKGMGSSPEAVAMISPSLGKHTLALRSFEVTRDAPARVLPQTAKTSRVKGLWLDDLGTGTVQWALLGQGDLSILGSSPLQSRALAFKYMQGPKNLAILVRPIAGRDLTPYDRIVFQAASAKSARMVLTLEELSGARYNAQIDLPGDLKPVTESISLASFQIADDSPPDPDGKLDLDKLKTLDLVDVTGYLGIGPQSNTLYIGPIRAVAEHL